MARPVPPCRANKAALVSFYHPVPSWLREPARRYVFPVWPSYGGRVNHIVAIGAKIGWETYAAVFRGWPPSAGCAGRPAGSVPREERQRNRHHPVDRAAPDLEAAAVAAVNKAGPSVVMVFSATGPATDSSGPGRNQATPAPWRRRSRSTAFLAVIKGIGDKSRGLAVPRVLPRPNDSDQPAGRPNSWKVMKEAGQDDQQPGHFSGLRGGQDHG